jgi:hypothetical protein
MMNISSTMQNDQPGGATTIGMDAAGNLTFDDNYTDT